MKYSKKETKIAKQIFEIAIVDNRINENRFRSLVKEIKKLNLRNTEKILQLLLKKLVNFYKKQTLFVKSPHELNPKDLDKLKKTFAEKMGKPLRLEFKKDTSLLAGIKITLGDTVWDYSVNSTLESFKAALRG